jgi:predicted dehydrogenase
MGYAVHVQWGPAGWFTQKELAGGGALADMGIHAIDTVRYLLSDPQPVSVYARIGTNYIDSNVDDTVLLLINWENGVTSYIEAGWWQPHSDGVAGATQLYGQQGFGSVFPTRIQYHSPQTGKMEVIDPGFVFPRPDHGLQEMYDRQMAHFLECISQGTTPKPGGAEGLLNMRISDAAYQSSRTGLVVRL